MAQNKFPLILRGIYAYMRQKAYKFTKKISNHIIFA